MGSSAPATPKAPSLAKSYQQGLQVYLNNLPQQLSAEENARLTYDPMRVAEQQVLQGTFGQNQYQQQLSALNQLDPQGQALRQQLGTQISGDLSTGYQLPPGYATQLQNAIRGAQTARGNALGNSATADEAGFMGQAALQLYQQKLQNAGNFLASPTPEQQLLAVQPVQADRTSQYTNPNAGYAGTQFALSNYQNLLAQQAASGAGQNPWASAIGGAATGASVGGLFGPYGAAIGAVGGGLYGAFSDRRLKENIERVGTLANGAGVYEFNYKADRSKRYRGLMADEIKYAVRKATGWLSDFMMVDYSALGLRLEEV